MESTNLAIAASAFGSFLIAYTLVLTASRHGRFTMDLPGAIQKFHSQPTPRVGGIGIYAALLLARSVDLVAPADAILSTIVVAGIPALLVGLAEDLTKRVPPWVRLAATIASGALAAWASGMTVRDLGWAPLDLLVGTPLLAFAFTAVAVAGVANAFNIIDGFNGLASGTATICLLGVAIAAGHAGDEALMLSALFVAAAVSGFWLVNFPWGKLFLGDGGAYFIGFAVAWFAVLLPVRNPQLSPWTALLICGYPVIEVMYSIVRRSRRGQAPSAPDREHLHSLLLTRLVQRKWSRLDPTLQNAAVSVPAWICAAFPALLGVTFSERTSCLAASAAASVLLYHWLYRKLSRP